MNDKQLKTSTAMIENAVGIAIQVGKDLLDGEVKDAFSGAGACLAQLFALEAMRQGKGAAPIVHDFRHVWNEALRRLTRQKLYRASMRRFEN